MAQAVWIFLYQPSRRICSIEQVNEEQLANSI